MDVKTLLAIGGLVSFIVGGTIGIEARYASSAYVKQVEQRLDQKIITDRMDSLQERMWKLDDRYGVECESCPPVVKDEYRELIKEYNLLEDRIRDDQDGP